ncbi:MAG TPA: hypothetical protein VIH29_09045 [Gallionella sp.]
MSGEALLRFVLKAVQHAIGENSFSDNCAEQIEQQLRWPVVERWAIIDRQQDGGCEVYVAKIDCLARKEEVLKDFNGCNRTEVCAKHRISKAQFYRMLKGE